LAKAMSADLSVPRTWPAIAVAVLFDLGRDPSVHRCPAGRYRYRLGQRGRDISAANTNDSARALDFLILYIVLRWPD